MGIEKKPGEITWVNVSAAPIPLKDMGVAIVYSDITERVQAQEETEEKFKNIIQNSTDAIIIVNQTGAIIEWNKGCEIIFGFNRKQVIGQKIWSFVEKVLNPTSAHIEESMFGRESIQNALKTGDSKWFKKINEIEILDSTGKSKTLQSVGFPVKSAQDYLLGVVARDISEAKIVENMLKEAKEKAEEASYIKSQFLANISHEIRTPLNAIMGFTEILREFQVTDNKFKSHLSGIEKSSKALMALINDILDLSRIEAGKMSLNPTPFNIANLVEDVKQIFSLKAGQKGLALNSEILPNTPSNILLDEIRLRQILFNLVGNAVKFTEKGYIRVTVQTIRKEPLNNAVDLIIKVIDSGPGIAQKELNEIFNPFYQKQPDGNQRQEGTGLGLAISRRFVEMMNGEISVNSMPGKGTEFVVFIPSVSVLEDFSGKHRESFSQNKDKNQESYSHKELVNLLKQELIAKYGSEEKANLFISDQIWSEYDKIADILGFDEVISFSTLLNSLAEKENLNFLKEFAALLSQEANSFNVIEINRLLASFETLRNS
jgi:PAS domain S-box-containing protein